MRKIHRKTETDFEVLADNWDSLLFFLDLRTQWNVVAGMAGERITGLNYQAVESIMRIKQIKQKDKLELFRDLQVMESAALDVMNKAK